MAKKEVPHLVYAKQKTIVNKDPFHTDKLEAQIGGLFQKRIEAFRDRVIAGLDGVVE